MKICTECLQEKPKDQFYKNHRCSDGLFPKCKSCCLDYSMKRYWADRKTQLEKCRLRWEKRKHSKAYKTQHAIRQRKYRAAFPERIKARRVVERALKRGTLTKGACEKCGTIIQIQAHHDDYSKPLTVRWFCFECHRKFHGMFTRVV